MTKSRMETFSDGVIAIIMTIMVLELSGPRDGRLIALRPMLPTIFCYALSFLILGIYWSNHHHLLQAVERVDGRILWANLHLLFWLTLIPFTTGWMGRTRFAPWPVALYGIVLLLAAIAYYILVHALIALHGNESVLATAMGNDVKGKVSVGIYAAAVALAFLLAPASCALYLAVAVIWLVPDRRIEKAVGPDGADKEAPA